ncbi:hypothetical protein DFA_11500 [Cavenderia fasciculata]|uniref:PBZ-type domain-containing protein n=1 Tax=Cavenderia fasciculata TaxID=261658 RepID=F4QDB1_CACFS|nr:uncharacterized protein DFA_11500 [Cavenderia fasciculata]EGG13739.1 hypothetical protein DFA_11500 [Cavenderia fasciculata]|eukprot:XP_004350443.1 hypothetical protein DFA_11500 [Cavenderia fasciculata]
MQGGDARHIITLSPTSSNATLPTLVFSKVGSFDVGRVSLKVDEKRCSRKQLIIKLDDHSNYYVSSDGMNPSYHKKYNKDDFIQMTKNQEYELEDGDQLSLLYEMYALNVSIASNPNFVAPKKPVSAAPSTSSPSIPVSKTSILKRKDPDTTPAAAAAVPPPPKDMDDYSDFLSSSSTATTTFTTTTSSSSKPSSQSDNSDVATIKKQKMSDLPECEYGKKCFRKNPQHFLEYSHPWKNEPTSSSSSDTPANSTKTSTTPTSSPASSQSSATTTSVTAQPIATKTNNTNQNNNNNNNNSSSSSATTSSSTSTAAPKVTSSSTTSLPSSSSSSSSSTVAPKVASSSSTTPSTSTTTSATTKSIYQKKKPTEIKNRQLTFPFISTFIYNFDAKKATDVAGPEIAEYLNVHKGEDDIKLIMVVDKSIYSQTLVNDFKKYINDKRFEIKSFDITNDKDQFKTDTRFYATETTWRLKRTAQNKILYDIAGVEELEKNTKTKYPNTGKAGCIYPVTLDVDNVLHSEYGMDALFLLIGPNLNDKKPDCLHDHEEATPVLADTYRQLFTLLDNYNC